jgi:hypothetical protein
MWHEHVGLEINELFAEGEREQTEDMRARLYRRYVVKLGSKERRNEYSRKFMAKRYAADKAAIATMREAWLLGVGERAVDLHEVDRTCQVGGEAHTRQAACGLVGG